MSRILIVDDNEQNNYMLESLLRGNDHVTVSASDGKQALILAKEEPPDLIITDILMPVMDGYELCRKLKKDKLLQRIPLIFYTATYTEPKDEKFALKLGAARFVIKPQEPEILLNLIKGVIEENLETPESTINDKPLNDNVILEEYREVLFRKLEKKVKQLEKEIQKREKTEKELKRSEVRYRLLFESAQDGLILVDTQTGMIVDVNPHAANISGFNRYDLINKIVWEVDFLKKIIPSKLVLDGYLSMNQIVLKAIYLNRKDNTKFLSEIVTCFYPVNETIILQINIRDITERESFND